MFWPTSQGKGESCQFTYQLLHLSAVTMSSQKIKSCKLLLFLQTDEEAPFISLFYELIGVKYSDSVSSEMEGLSKTSRSCGKNGCMLRPFGRKSVILQLESERQHRMEVQIERSWKAHLEPEFTKPYFAQLTEAVRQEYAAFPCYPPGRWSSMLSTFAPTTVWGWWS